MSSPRRHVGAALLVAALTVAGGCSDPPPDPDQERLERVETRLDESFSGAQVTCLLDVLDDDTLRALDLETDLDPGADAVADYSAAVAACVADPDARPAADEPADDGPDGGEPTPDDDPDGDEPTPEGDEPEG